MSYILDALKKSSEERRRLQEQEAQQGALPLNSQVTQKTPGQNRLLMVLLMVSVLAFSAVGWWFVSSTEKSAGDVSPPGPAITPEPQQSQVEKTTAGPQTVGTGTVAPSTTERPAAPDKNEPAAGRNLEKPLQTFPESKLPLMEELPLALRAQLPEMKFSGHVFSPTPELRMIMINTSVVREGDLIDADLRLMEITRDGLIMSHKGTDFMVVLF